MILKIYGLKIKNYLVYAVGVRKMRECKLFVDGKCFGLWIFSIAFVIRLLPEFLSGPYPVGYDLLAGYAPSLYVFPDDAPLRLFGWAWSPLAVYILWFFWKLSGVDLFSFLKMAGPVFYGLFVLSFYYLLWRGVGWSEKKSFVTALLFLLQPAVLRTGWDQLREELGFVFLFVLLAETRLDVIAGARKKPFMVCLLSVLVVLSHQLATVLLFVVMVWQFMDILVRKRSLPLRGLVAFIPSAFVFIWGLYGQFVCPNYSDRFMPIQLPSGTGFFAFTNYFLSDPRFVGGDWFRVLAYVGSLSLYCVVPLVPLAVKGFFKDNVFMPILVWLCVASYSIVVFPWFAFSHYWWWILLLPIPLTVYLGEGLERLEIFTSNPKRFKIAVAGLILLCIVGFGYATSIIRIGYPYAYSYLPSGLVESAIPFEDMPEFMEALEWVNQNATVNFTVIVDEKFQGIAYAELRTDIKILVAPPLMKLSDVFEIIDKRVSLSCFVVYYEKNAEEYDQCKKVSFGKIGIYLID